MSTLFQIFPRINVKKGSWNNVLVYMNGINTILESILSVPMTLGELSFGIWLLIKGGKVGKSG